MNRCLLTLLVCTPMLVSQSVLTTTFAHNNGQSGNMFDIVATNNVIITGFDINMDPGADTVEVYAVTGGGTFVGNETNTAAWTLIASVPVTSLATSAAAPGTPTPIPAGFCVAIPAGSTQGFYVTMTTTTLINYTNGTTQGAVYASDANIQFQEGIGLAYPFGGSFSPRVWNGNIYYSLGTACIPAYQVNQPNSSLDIDGAQSYGYSPAQTTVCPGDNFQVNINSAVPTSYEIGVSATPAIPLGTPPAFTTGGGQIVNVDLTHPSFVYLNSFSPTVPSLTAFASGFTINAAIYAPVTLAAQMGVLDPTHADFISLSQASELTVLASGATIYPGPTGEDSFLQVDIGIVPTCGPASIPFFGTSYSTFYISSNGRVTFTAGNTSPSPALATALSGPPFVGLWTDLSPVSGGTISYSTTTSAVGVTWSAVPYFSETNTATLTLSLDATGLVSLGVAGVMSNPITSGFGNTGDAQFLGMSPGIGASDPGITAFTAGGSGGAPALPTDMIYDFMTGPQIMTAGGLLPSVTSLQTATGTLTFVPAGNTYSWVGL